MQIQHIILKEHTIKASSNCKEIQKQKDAASQRLNNRLLSRQKSIKKKGKASSVATRSSVAGTGERTTTVIRSQINQPKVQVQPQTIEETMEETVEKTPEKMETETEAKNSRTVSMQMIAKNNLRKMGRTKVERIATKLQMKGEKTDGLFLDKRNVALMLKKIGITDVQIMKICLKELVMSSDSNNITRDNFLNWVFAS